jgi:hypothetical protein
MHQGLAAEGREAVAAHTVGKKVVLITWSDEDIPSDIKHFDLMSYAYDPEGAQTLLGKLHTFIKSHFHL